MKIGFNMLLWTPDVREEHYGYFDKLKAAGYDGVELPLFNPDLVQYAGIGKALKERNLGCTAVTIIPDPALSPISPDASVRRAGEGFLKKVIDCCQASGAEVLCGPFYQPLGKFSGNPPTEQEKDWAAEVHRNIADYAQSAGVTLAVEALNRFECYFINTTGDAAAYAKRVNKPNFGILYDTFHMNIEEKYPVEAIAQNIAAIKHVHVSSNQRGTPGKDHIPWDDTFKALRGGGYDGWLTIEAFGRSMPELAATTCVWRDLSASNEDVYEEGYRMIRQKWDTAA